MKNEKTKVWDVVGDQLYLTSPANEINLLENVVYTVKVHPQRGFYLTKVVDNFKFDYKLYGLETALINRVIKTYNTTGHGNLGVLMNGIKGTGKTVSSKLIANAIEQPVIIVSEAYQGVQYFLNSIPQNVTIFIDEYEKIYGQSNDMLTIMDGAMNSEYRRLFLLTTNKLNIEDNMKQRPSRIRYIKKFGDLPPSVVAEIVDDILIHKHFRDECISFMTTLELITVDIVKAIINEVNIHDESPFEFGDIFNVNKIEGKYKVYVIDAENKSTLEADNVNLYPRPMYSDEQTGYWFEVNGRTIGRVIKVIDEYTLVVAVLDDEDNVVDLLTLRVERTYGTHYSYAYSNGHNANSPVMNGKLKSLLTKNDEVETLLLKHKNGELFKTNIGSIDLTESDFDEGSDSYIEDEMKSGS